MHEWRRAFTGIYLVILGGKELSSGLVSNSPGGEHWQFPARIRLSEPLTANFLQV
jgi:hypothetical protein